MGLRAALRALCLLAVPRAAVAQCRAACGSEQACGPLSYEERKVLVKCLDACPPLGSDENMIPNEGPECGHIGYGTGLDIPRGTGETGCSGGCPVQVHGQVFADVREMHRTGELSNKGIYHDRKKPETPPPPESKEERNARYERVKAATDALALPGAMASQKDVEPIERVEAALKAKRERLALDEEARYKAVERAAATMRIKAAEARAAAVTDRAAKVAAAEAAEAPKAAPAAAAAAAAATKAAEAEKRAKLAAERVQRAAAVAAKHEEKKLRSEENAKRDAERASELRSREQEAAVRGLPGAGADISNVGPEKAAKAAKAALEPRDRPRPAAPGRAPNKAAAPKAPKAQAPKATAPAPKAPKATGPAAATAP